MALDAARANNILDAIHGVDSFVDPTLPLKVRLMRITGSATANGTEVTAGAGSGTGAGYTAGGEDIAFDAAVSRAAAMSADITWSNMPATTIAGIEVWDSATTPKRWLWGTFTSVVLASGSSFTLTAALFTDTLS